MGATYKPGLQKMIEYQKRKAAERRKAEAEAEPLPEGLCESCGSLVEEGDAYPLYPVRKDGPPEVRCSLCHEDIVRRETKDLLGARETRTHLTSGVYWVTKGKNKNEY